MSAGEVFFALAFARRADDEAAGHSGVMDLQNPLQPLAFLVARDLARNAGVLHASACKPRIGPAARCAT